jgi:hypothetical protein
MCWGRACHATGCMACWGSCCPAEIAAAPACSVLDHHAALLLLLKRSAQMANCTAIRSPRAILSEAADRTFAVAAFRVMWAVALHSSRVTSPRRSTKLFHDLLLAG